MTECDSLQLRLTLLHDGELPEAEAIALREHLETCPTCRDACNEMEQVLALANSWAIPPAMPVSASPVAEESIGAILRDLREEIRALRAEVSHLRSEVSALRGTGSSRGTATVTHTPKTAYLMPYAPEPAVDLLSGFGRD
jgi:anti-sigma factor RsiW